MLILQNESVLACLSAGFGTFALSFIVCFAGLSCCRYLIR